MEIKSNVKNIRIEAACQKKWTRLFVVSISFGGGAFSQSPHPRKRAGPGVAPGPALV